MADISDNQKKARLGLSRAAIVDQPRENLSEASDSAPEESSEQVQKMRLALLKSSAQNTVKNTVDKQGGAVAGEVVGGWIGSIIPFGGTVIGAFLGRLLGKKLGITGIIVISIIILVLIILLMMFLIFIVIQAYCGNYLTVAFDKNTIGICKNISLLQNIK